MSNTKAAVWLETRYDLNLAALEDLGFGERELGVEVPAFEEIRDSLCSENLDWLYERRMAGHRDELVISPSIQRIGLRLGETALLPRFDYGSLRASRVSPAWNRFPNGDPTHDNGSEPWPVAILLGDVADPRDPAQPVNEYEEKGLVYTKMVATEQQKVVEDERSQHIASGRQLSHASIAEIVIVNAQRRQAGIPMLDGRTYTRLVRYSGKRDIALFSKVIAVGRINDRLDLCEPFAFFRSRHIGMRRSLKIPIVK